MMTEQRQRCRQIGNPVGHQSPNLLDLRGEPVAANVLDEVDSQDFMLSRCANPECGKPFVKLREGRLFVVERADQAGSLRRKRPSIEHYWLCDECAITWTVAYDLTHGISVVPLRRPMTLAGAERRIAQASVRTSRRQS